MPLEDEDAELVSTLKRRFAKRRLAEADLPSERLEDAIKSVELRVARSTS